MAIVLVDVFTVPQKSMPQFKERSLISQNLVKTLPGFVEGYVYELYQGESKVNIFTTAVWESEADYENAKQAVAEAYQKQGFNPQTELAALNVDVVRSIYTRELY